MLNLKIADIEKEYFNSNISQVTVMTVEGEITILPEHAPLISIIRNGYVLFNNERINIKLGTIDIIDNNVQILIGERENDEEII